MTVAVADRPDVATPSPARSVWRPLARREARFVLRHPLTLAGVVASLYLLWSFDRETLLPHFWANSTYVGLGLAPLAGAGLLVGHLVASRAHRHDTLEMEETAPAVQRARTFGRLVGCLVTMPLAAAVVAIYLAYLYAQGATATPLVGELLVGPLVVGIATAAGVAVGTWFPNRFSGLVALGLLAAVQITFQDAEGTRHWLAWWHTVLWHGAPDLWIRPTWAHLAYLAGVLLVVSALALLRHGARHAAAAVLGLGAVLALSGAAVQMRPPSPSAVDARFDRIADPAGYWVEIDGQAATFRVHPGYERWTGRWDSVIERVLAPVPAAVRPDMTVEQRHHPYLSQVQEEFGWNSPEGQEIQRRGSDLDFRLGGDGVVDLDPWPIEVDSEAYVGQDRRLALAVAVRATGLPLLPVQAEGRPYTEEEIASFHQEQAVDGATDTTGPWWPGQEQGRPAPQLGDRWPVELACTPEGQAREVLAAWLAASAAPDLAAEYAAVRADGLERHNPNGDGGIYAYAPADGSETQMAHWASLGWGWSMAGYGDVGQTRGFVSSPTATDLAAQLLELPADEVSAAMADHWDEWIDPATGVSTIVEAFGLEPPPTPEQWLQRSGRDPSDFADSIAAYPMDLGEEDLLGQPHPVCE